MVRAAQLPAARGEVADALELYREAGESDALRTIVRASAPDWARQGRGPRAGHC